MAELGTKELAVEADAPAPSLLSLCLDAVAACLTRDSAGVGAGGTGWPGGCSGDAGPGGFAEEGGGEEDDGHLGPEQLAEVLPSELLHRLASRLPPAALETLHHAAHARCCSCADTAAGFGGRDGDRRGIKRSRCEDFNTAWQSLFKLRWPLSVNAEHDSVVTVDWQQQYWEKHLQDCLDEATESALLPSFRGNIGELSIPAKIKNSIYRIEDISQQHSRLTYQLSRFGCYARCMRLQGVLCTADTYDLLQHCKLERLMFIRIISEPEVNGVCLLLNCHAETLLSLEFIHCQLHPVVMDKICDAIVQRGSSHGIERFSIKSSRICETRPVTIPAGLLNFLSSGKSLHLLSLRDTKMQSSFAQVIIHTLLESSCGLQTLEISENNIAGWLSKVNKSPTSSSLTLKSDISLSSLSVLNLRGNNLQKNDIVDLHKILMKMPNLRDLDISGNPIMDEGIRSLIPFISWAIQKEDPLLRLRVESCDLSSIGVSKLLECLTSVKQPLDVLSIADNMLGSSVAAVLAKFLGSHVRDLNVEDIDLGTLGFQVLEEALPTEVALSHINISKNRGGIRAAYFVSKLILQAPNLVSVNAAANILPPESLEIICNTLKQRTCDKKTNGNLERVDLSSNLHLLGTVLPAFLELKKHGKPILIFSSNLSTYSPYDNDP